MKEIRNRWTDFWLTRSSSLIISAMPGLISRSSAFASDTSGSTDDCAAIGNSGVLMFVAWRPADAAAAAAAAAADDDDDNGDKLLRFFGVTDAPVCIVFVLIVNSFDATVSEVRRIDRIFECSNQETKQNLSSFNAYILTIDSLEMASMLMN